MANPRQVLEQRPEVGTGKARGGCGQASHPRLRSGLVAERGCRALSWAPRGCGTQGRTYLSRVSMLGCRELAEVAPATREGLQPAPGPGPGPPAPSQLAAEAAAAAATGLSMTRQAQRLRWATVRSAAASRLPDPPPAALLRRLTIRVRRQPPLAVTWRPRVTHKATRGGGRGRCRGGGVGAGRAVRGARATGSHHG